MRIEANQIHAQVNWPTILEQAGIDAKFLRNQHGPCPACGGKDRYRFDNKGGKGTFFCSGCGPGDGFTLLMRTFGMRFTDAIARVRELAGISEPQPVVVMHQPAQVVAAKPTGRIVRLLRETCRIEDCPAAIAYLKSRKLWPLPTGHSLKAHPSVEYFHERQVVARLPALIAPVTNGDGELVTVHVTYLTESGEKFSLFESRKILSAMTGHEGCAVRLAQPTVILGIAEGIETALSAAELHSMPVWAALNTALLQKFSPPPGVQRVVIFADRDVAGLDAAARLTERLQGRVEFQLAIPKAKDWNDELRSA